MAKTQSRRNRDTGHKVSTNDDVVDSTTEVEVVNNDTTQTKGTVKQMAGLTPEQIQALLGSTRTKGLYLAKINQFVESGEAGIAVAEEWPMEFAEKAYATVKQGFENAKNSKNYVGQPDQVKVIVNEEKVYLINLGATTEAAA